MCHGRVIRWICLCDRAGCPAKNHWEEKDPGHVRIELINIEPCGNYASRSRRHGFIPPCTQWVYEDKMEDEFCDICEEERCHK